MNTHKCPLPWLNSQLWTNRQCKEITCCFALNIYWIRFFGLQAALLFFSDLSITALVDDDFSYLRHHKVTELFITPPSPRIHYVLHNYTNCSILPQENQTYNMKLNTQLWVYSQHVHCAAGTVRQGWLKITTCKGVGPPRSATSAWQQVRRK